MPPLSLVAVLMATVLAACGPTGVAEEMEEEPRGDGIAPILVVESPERGTTLDRSEVTVRGFAHDEGSGVAEVMVNQTRAPLASDGSFEVSVSVPPGITLLRTVARDRAGNETAETRAVLAGNLVSQDTPVADAVVAHIGKDTLSVLAGMVTKLANQTDFTAIAKSLNPVVDTGDGCLSAKVDVLSIKRTGITMDARPTAGGIAFDVIIKGLDVQMRANYRVACVSASAGLYLTADSLRFSGVIKPRLSGSSIRIDLANLTAQFTGFQLQVGIIPSSVVELFVSDIDKRVAGLLIGPIQSMVPSMANAFLADLDFSQWPISVLGRSGRVSIRPTTLQFTSQGGTVALESSISVNGVEGVRYLSARQPRPTAALAKLNKPFRVGVSDDIINQALAVFWASGAMDDVQTVREDDPLRGIFGDDVNQIATTMLLPPVVSAVAPGAPLQLKIGDLIVDVLDTESEDPVLMRFAVSAELDLEVEVGTDGRPRIKTGEPQMTVDILVETGANLLSANQLEALLILPTQEMVKQVNRMLGTLPLPTFGDAGITRPTFTQDLGYLLIGAGLK